MTDQHENIFSSWENTKNINDFSKSYYKYFIYDNPFLTTFLANKTIEQIATKKLMRTVYTKNKKAL